MKPPRGILLYGPPGQWWGGCSGVVVGDVCGGDLCGVVVGDVCGKHWQTNCVTLTWIICLSENLFTFIWDNLVNKSVSIYGQVKRFGTVSQPDPVSHAVL